MRSDIRAAAASSYPGNMYIHVCVYSTSSAIKSTHSSGTLSNLSIPKRTCLKT